MQNNFPYTITPLGDSALLLHFSNTIDRGINRQVQAIHHFFSQHHFIGLTDIIPAYSSITFRFDPFCIQQKVIPKTPVFDWVLQQVESRLSNVMVPEDVVPELVKVPVCYDEALGNDLENMVLQTKMDKREITALHQSIHYFVYMIGFLPGFAYMGEVDDRLVLPRKTSPQKVKKGSVAIAGKQTGIYPADSFGGWNILGFTPVNLFDASIIPDLKNGIDPCLLKAGQEVSFYEISLEEYHSMNNLQ